MPTPEALKSLERVRNAGSGFAPVLPKRPRFPREVLLPGVSAELRQAALAKWDKDLDEYDSKANILLGRIQGI